LDSQSEDVGSVEEKRREKGLRAKQPAGLEKEAQEGDWTKFDMMMMELPALAWPVRGAGDCRLLLHLVRGRLRCCSLHALPLVNTHAILDPEVLNRA
jgi:hypothetical protein